nr:MAG TPA: hypothetical protein [Caudoviricetes sp.]
MKFFRENCKLFFRGHFGQISEYTFAYFARKTAFLPGDSCAYAPIMV